ncbi:MAG: hypothetical protein U9N09_04585 [Euryarchaeota archaeon]|nr:hypothetical protein [Euryarchaeota archaeon]
MGDEMDFFEWHALCDMHKRLAAAEMPDEKTTLQQQIDAIFRCRRSDLCSGRRGDRS